MSKVIWTPQPRQAEMMRRGEYEGFYGGAAGGGKSDYLVIEALRQVHIPHYRGLILRKTFPQLTELIDKSENYYRRVFPKAKYNGSGHVWVFPSGAKIYFGSMQYEKDKTRYQGKAYDFIGFDELTHFTYSEYSYLFSRNRPNGPGTRVYIRSTGNPGGVGHGWVKERFVKAGHPGEPITTQLQIITPEGTINKKRKRIFVPSSVFDNKILLNNDPNYLANMAMMPEQERKALLYGDWDTFAGQVFTEWRDNPDGYDTHVLTHVIHSFRIPTDWKIYRGFDWGYSKPFSVVWIAVSKGDSRFYMIREWYGCTKDPNTGLKLTPQEIARGIREREQADPNIKGHQVIGIADPAIFSQDGGESIAEMMEKCGVYNLPGDHTRIAGKMQLHYRLAFDENGIPMMYVFDTCKEFIRCFPSLVYDDTKVEDIDTDQEDHCYDSARYVCMEHPLNPRSAVNVIDQVYDPFRTDDDKPDRFAFYRI